MSPCPAHPIPASCLPIRGSPVLFGPRQHPPATETLSSLPQTSPESARSRATATCSFEFLDPRVRLRKDPRIFRKDCFTYFHLGGLGSLSSDPGHGPLLSESRLSSPAISVLSWPTPHSASLITPNLALSMAVPRCDEDAGRRGHPSALASRSLPTLQGRAGGGGGGRRPNPT